MALVSARYSLITDIDFRLINSRVQFTWPGMSDRKIRSYVSSSRLGSASSSTCGIIGGQVATIIAGVLAAYLLITGLLARCLLYKVIDVDTSVQEQPYSTTDDRAGL